jgi:Trypsin
MTPKCKRGQARSAATPTFRTELALALVAASLGCGTHVESDATREQAAPIVFGEPSPSPDDDAVVLLRHVQPEGEYLCTGTMIAPNLVVTARHCVAFASEAEFQCTVQGEPIAVGDGGGVLGADIPAESIEVYAGEIPGSVPVAKGREIVSTLSLTECINDLAFVVLDRSLALPIAGVRLGTKTVPGEAVSVVGYGIEQAGPSELDWPARPRNKSHQVLAAVGPDATENVTTVRARTLVTQGPSACKGDSGGPALSDKTRAVVGVYTVHGGSADCKSPSVVHYYTHLSPFGALTMQAFARAGATPMIEKRGAFGEACQEASDCEEGACVAGDDGASRCSRTCGSAPCPDGYDCRPPVTQSGPNVCTALVVPDAGCAACDAGPTPAPPAPPSSGGGCAFSPDHAAKANTVVAALAFVSMVVIRKRRMRCRRSCS